MFLSSTLETLVLNVKSIRMHSTEVQELQIAVAPFDTKLAPKLWGSFQVPGAARHGEQEKNDKHELYFVHTGCGTHFDATEEIELILDFAVE